MDHWTSDSAVRTSTHPRALYEPVPHYRHRRGFRHLNRFGSWHTQTAVSAYHARPRTTEMVSTRTIAVHNSATAFPARRFAVEADEDVKRCITRVHATGQAQGAAIEGAHPNSDVSTSSPGHFAIKWNKRLLRMLPSFLINNNLEFSS